MAGSFTAFDTVARPSLAPSPTPKGRHSLVRDDTVSREAAAGGCEDYARSAVVGSAQVGRGSFGVGLVRAGSVLRGGGLLARLAVWAYFP